MKQQAAARSASADGLKNVLTLSARGAPMDQVLQAIVDTAAELGGPGTRAALFLRRHAGPLPDLRAASGMPEEFVAALRSFPVGPGSPSWEQAAPTGHQMIIRDVEADPACASLLALARRHAVRAIWSYALLSHEGRVLGNLALYRARQGEPDARAQRDLDCLADLASLVIERDELVEQAGRRHRLYQTLLENTPDLAYVFDLQHRFVYANEILLRMWNRDWDDAIGKTCLELGYEPWHAAMHGRELEQVKLSRAPVRGEVPFNGSFGRRIYEYIFVPVLGPDGQVEAIAGTTRDVTERKSVENQLRESEAHLALMFEQTAVGFAESTLDGRFTRGNARICDMLGISREELPSLGIASITHPADLPSAMERLNNLVATGKPVHVEKRYRRRDGTYRWGSFSVSLVRGQDDQPSSVLAVVQDISEHKEREQELRDTNRRKDEFLAMLAHELRNPLAPISAAAELLSVSDDPQLAISASDVIQRQTRHMTALVDDLLDVSRVTRGLIILEQEHVDMCGVLTDAAEQVRPLLSSRHHQLRLELPSRPHWVLGDQKRLVQIIANLLNNAAKYTDDGGAISLSLQMIAGWVEVAVRDNGMGMPPELLERVFELFVQADRSYDRSHGGLGLGLALVKSLAQLHGGSVSATSAGVGQGSEFRLRLPADAGPPHEAAVAASGATASCLRLLVVDDNPDAATMLAELLRACGHEVLVEHAPRAVPPLALEWRPDACLLDIGMPDMNGLELARALRGLAPLRNCLLIAITGYGGEQDRRDSASAGFDHHMVKPVDLSKLLELLGRGRPGPGVSPRS